jgi:DCN1-like protein 1/2
MMCNAGQNLHPALDLWNLYIPPALESRPSALSRIPPSEPPNSPSTTNPPEFTKEHFEQWIEFQKKKSKAISKDTWSLFVDFIRSIDGKFQEYDDSGQFTWIPIRGS